MTKAKIARANGAKSKGPKTKEGKAKCSLNARTHGITSRTLVLQNENPTEFLALFNRYLNRYKPKGQEQLDLLTDAVAARWRLIRIWKYQTALEDMEMKPHPDEDVRGALAFHAASTKSGTQTALRYEAQLQKTYRRSLTLLSEIANRTNKPKRKEDVL